MSKRILLGAVTLLSLVVFVSSFAVTNSFGIIAFVGGPLYGLLGVPLTSLGRAIIGPATNLAANGFSVPFLLARFVSPVPPIVMWACLRDYQMGTGRALLITLIATSIWSGVVTIALGMLY